MDNKFKNFYSEKKWFLFTFILYTFLISAIVKKVKPQENILNFFIYYIVSAIVFYFVYAWIEKHYSRERKNKGDIN